MIVEMRTYDLKPGSVAEVEKRFAEPLPARMKLSPLAAFWHTEVGPLNRIIHLWPYADMGERTRIRAEAVSSGIWPPKIGEFIDAMQSDILIPAPSSPPLEPRALGAIYEIRIYTLAPGAIPGMIERWNEKIAERVKLSPLVGAWHTDIGALNKWVHIWAYKDAGERGRIRADAIARGIWPPRGAPGALVRQETMLVVPAEFSPLR